MTTSERERRFRDLYGSTRSRVIAYALRRVSSADDAADIVAETYTIAWRKLDDIPDDAGLFWLYATCRRVIANYGRRERRRSDLVVRLGAQLRHVAVGTVEGIDGASAAQALRRLRDDDREILLLVGWEGLTSAELAKVLDCSATAARIRLHRARSRLIVEMDSPDIGVKHETVTRHLQSRTAGMDGIVPETPREA